MSDIREFDVTDFSANPGKYRFFKTARINFPLDGFKLGQYVAVHCTVTRFNAFMQRDEPLFVVRDNHGQRRVLFGSALGSFVL
jgi:hypothetical protein